MTLDAGLDEKVERAKDELESIKAELAMAIEKVKKNLMQRLKVLLGSNGKRNVKHQN